MTRRQAQLVLHRVVHCKTTLVWDFWKWKHCDLDENSPYRLIYLNAWSLIGRSTLEGLGGVLLEVGLECPRLFCPLPADQDVSLLPITL